jgi:hypothetical protein
MSGPESVDGDAKEAKNAWEFLHGKMCRKCSRHLLRRIKELKAEIARLKGEEHDCDSRNSEKDAV